MEPNGERAADVAVVVTCHNYGHYLDACLASVMAQTLKPRELVVVDDASSDATHAVVSRFPRAVYVRVDYANANRSRNHGFASTTAPYVVFFDADNTMSPEFLESLYAALQEDEGAAFAYPDRINVVEEAGGRRSPLPAGHWPSHPFDVERLRRANYIDLAAMIRRKAFPGFDEALRMYQDWDLWLNIACNGGGRGRHVPRPLFCYRVHPNSLGHRGDPDPALWRIRRKYRLGAFGRTPLLRDSLTAFRILRRLRRWV